MNGGSDLKESHGGFWQSDEDEDSELDQLWFDPWEGQIELSTTDISPYVRKSASVNNDLFLEEISDELRVMSPLEKRRKSLLRQTSLPVFNQPIYATNSPGDTTDDFHTTHTLYWSNQYNNGSEGVQMLQEQVGHLAESQATTDDRYSKVKQENATLTQKVHMLEEHIREVELQSQERLVEEQKRNKELLQRLEREKVLEVENYAIRLQSAERDLASSHRELTSLRSQIDRLKIDKSQLEQELFETQQSYTLLQKECTILGDSCKRAQEQADNERADNAHLVGELTKEVDSLRGQLRSRSEDVITDSKGSTASKDSLAISRVNDMEAELRSLREDNRKLTESNEEMQAQVLNRGYEIGQSVLISAAGAASISIADELGNLPDNQIRNALKEQQDVNAHLRGYIDGILMNIMETYPALLEVKK